MPDLLTVPLVTLRMWGQAISASMLASWTPLSSISLRHVSVPHHQWSTEGEPPHCWWAARTICTLQVIITKACFNSVPAGQYPLCPGQTNRVSSPPVPAGQYPLSPGQTNTVSPPPPPPTHLCLQDSICYALAKLTVSPPFSACRTALIMSWPN